MFALIVNGLGSTWDWFTRISGLDPYFGSQKDSALGHLVGVVFPNLPIIAFAIAFIFGLVYCLEPAFALVFGNGKVKAPSLNLEGDAVAQQIDALKQQQKAAQEQRDAAQVQLKAAQEQRDSALYERDEARVEAEALRKRLRSFDGLRVDISRFVDSESARLSGVFDPPRPDDEYRIAHEFDQGEFDKLRDRLRLALGNTALMKLDQLRPSGILAVRHILHDLTRLAAELPRE